MASGSLGFVHSSASCGREKHPVCWRESSVQHCPLNHVISWKALSARKHLWANTWASLCEKEFSDEDNCTLRSSPLSLFLPCGQRVTLVVTSPHPGPQLVWMRRAVDILLSRLDKGHIYLFCPFQRLDPGHHKAPFSPRSGRIAYWIHQPLAEIPCSWHQEQKK